MNTAENKIVLSFVSFLLPSFAFFSFPSPSLAYEVTPYFNASLLGGQYFFQGQEGSLAGNFNLLTSASVKVSPNLTVVPLYNAKYQGTKQVTDLVGGGTLFQELVDQRAAVRGIYSISPAFRLKPEAGFKWQFLKETRDEKWGKGLFDYQRPGFSLEGEYIYKDPFSLRMIYDLYYIKFLNYTSLESQIGQSAGSMAREMAGANVLNSLNHAFTVSANRDMPWRSLAEASLMFTLRSYGEQHVIDQAGQFLSGTRSDQVGMFDFNWRFPRKNSRGVRFVPGAGVTAVVNRSNQNSYDAQKTTYLDKYYDYDKFRIGADVLAQFPLSQGNSSADLRAGVGWTRTGYSHRPVQDAAGLYLSDRIYLNELTAGGSFSYPLVPGFRLTAVVQYGKQTSNMAYEKLYRYNFDVFTYLMGVMYEY